MSESTLSPDEQRQLKEDFSQVLGPLVDVPRAEVFIPDPRCLARRYRRRPPRWMVFVLAGLLLSSGGIAGAETLFGPITFHTNQLPVPKHPTPVPKHLPASQTAISRQRAMAIAETYLQKGGSQVTASSAKIVSRQTLEFQTHAASRNLPAYLWEVTFHHVNTPTSGPRMVATLVVEIGTQNGMVYGFSWNNH